MVAQLLRLRLSQLLVGARQGARDRGQMLGLTAFVLASAVLLLLSLYAVPRGDIPSVGAWYVLIGGAVVLGALLGTVFLGLHAGLDPRAFSLIGIASWPLSLGLTVAGTATVPTLAVAILVFGMLGIWGGSAALVAVFAAVLSVLTVVLVARVGTSLSSLLRPDSPAIRSGLLTAAIVGVLAALGTVVLLRSFGRGVAPEEVLEAAALVGWTPLAAAWAAPVAAADDDLAGAWLRILIAVVTLAGLAWLHERLLNRINHTPIRRIGARVDSVGVFESLPASGFGVVAGRSLINWVRDERYRVALLAVPVLPLLALPILALAGVPWAVLVLLPAPLMCLMIGWLPHNDVAHDYSAFWVHVATSISGRADRAGRLVPPLLLGVLVAVFGSLVGGVLSGNLLHVFTSIGLSLAALGAGLGLSSIVSVLWPYATVHPGEDPFHQPQFRGRAAVLAQAGTMAAAVALTAPTQVFFFQSILTEVWFWPLVTLGVGALTACIAIWAGIELGGRHFEQRRTEVFSAVLRG